MSSMAESLLMIGTAQPEEEQQEILSALVIDHASMIYAIALSILRHSADAEDAAQDCFLKVIKHRLRLAFALDKRAFIARIAQRCALDRLNRRPPEDPLEDVHAAPNSNPDIEQTIELAALLNAIRSLPEELRRVVELQQSGELTSEEIGKVLGIPAATVRSRSARAKSVLRQKLERRTR
jgi:RNA polymerase sigma factor (sigma-70 family)